MDNFPGTQRRFAPGFYFGQVAIGSAQSFWNSNLAPKVSSWTPDGSGIYLGFFLQIGWKTFYSNENNRPSNPEDHTNTGYNWSSIDSWLALDCVANGPCKIFPTILLRNNRIPNWAEGNPYNCDVMLGTVQVFAVHRATAIAEWLKFCKAFAGRYGMNSKIAAVQLTEHVRFGFTPSDWNAPIGGGVGGYTGQKAWDYGIITSAKSMFNECANMTVFQTTVNNETAYGYDQFAGQGIVDAGCGVHLPDPRFFNGACGDNGGFNNNDCGAGFYGVAQLAKDSVPICPSHEANGWSMENFPTNVNPWAKQAGTKFSTIPLELYYWYFAGPPTASPPNDNSGLGRPGTDPPGIIASHYLRCLIGTSLNWTFAQHAACIDRFGKPGTGASPYLPAGYLEPSPAGEPPSIPDLRLRALSSTSLSITGTINSGDSSIDDYEVDIYVNGVFSSSLSSTVSADFNDISFAGLPHTVSGITAGSHVRLRITAQSEDGTGVSKFAHELLDQANPEYRFLVGNRSSGYTDAIGRSFSINTPGNNAQVSYVGFPDVVAGDPELYGFGAWDPDDGVDWEIGPLQLNAGTHRIAYRIQEPHGGLAVAGARVWNIVAYEDGVGEVGRIDSVDLGAAGVGSRWGYITYHDVDTDGGDLSIIVERVTQNPHLQALEISALSGGGTPPPEEETLFADALASVEDITPSTKGSFQTASVTGFTQTGFIIARIHNTNVSGTRNIAVRHGDSTVAYTAVPLTADNHSVLWLPTNASGITNINTAVDNVINARATLYGPGLNVLVNKIDISGTFTYDGTFKNLDLSTHFGSDLPKMVLIEWSNTTTANSGIAHPSDSNIADNYGATERLSHRWATVLNGATIAIAVETGQTPSISILGWINSGVSTFSTPEDISIGTFGTEVDLTDPIAAEASALFVTVNGSSATRSWDIREKDLYAQLYKDRCQTTALITAEGTDRKISGTAEDSSVKFRKIAHINVLGVPPNNASGFSAQAISETEIQVTFDGLATGIELQLYVAGEIYAQSATSPIVVTGLNALTGYLLAYRTIRVSDSQTSGTDEYGIVTTLDETAPTSTGDAVVMQSGTTISILVPEAVDIDPELTAFIEYQADESGTWVELDPADNHGPGGSFNSVFEVSASKIQIRYKLSDTAGNMTSYVTGDIIDLLGVPQNIQIQFIEPNKLRVTHDAPT